MAYYLKYRPQSLEDLIGQETPKKALLGAFQNGKLSHAYLFVGPRGTGKTSTARILAKMVNCEKSSVVSHQSSDDYPCNKCNTCLSITDGSNLDLIEIDAASNRGIEDIRSLREKIKLSPSNAKKKIYIIDEVHMLTPEAFNALLKTLEEPPSHAIFILATTDAGKLPQTILSRVQRLDFKPATPSEMLEVLKKIVSQEKIDIDDMALNLLVKKSEGSFRDGVKLLDQIASMGGKITMQLLQKSLRSTNFDVILELLEAFGKKDTTAALSIILKQVDEGVDSKELILTLMDTFRNLIFIKYGLGEKYQQLEKLAKNFSTQDLVRDLDILQKAFEKLKFASIPSLPLELAVVEMTQSVILSERSESKDLLRMQVPNKLGDSSLVVQNDKEEEDGPDLADSSDIAKLKEKWTFVLETIRPYNFSLEALLRSINITECSETTIIMEVPYSFHKRILETPKNRDLLESILSDILGRSIHLSTILGNRPSRREDIANIEVAADDEIIRAAAEIFNSDSVN